jgi:RNA-directed DNA polymerase
MDGSRNWVYHIETRAFRVFNKESKQTRYTRKKLLDKAFPTVPYSESKFVNVKGNKSPYDGDITYWSERNSKLYDGETSKALKRQSHKCGECGLKMLGDEKVHLHHVDGNHGNSKTKNLLAVHSHLPRLSPHEQRGKPRTSGAECGETSTFGSKSEVRRIIPSIGSTREKIRDYDIIWHGFIARHFAILSRERCSNIQ